MIDGSDGLSGQQNAGDAFPSSLFTAISGAARLKLEPDKDSVDVIAIDHIDPPLPN